MNEWTRTIYLIGALGFGLMADRYANKYGSDLVRKTLFVGAIILIGAYLILVYKEY